MGLIFFPRGGSAHVARNLARNLPGAGWDVTVVSGSLTLPGRPGDAREFYRGVDVQPVDMTAALVAEDPMLADPPLHPSYEDRPGAHDRVFAALDDRTYQHQARAWARALARAGAADAGGDRERRRPLGARTGGGRADARGGARLPAADRAVGLAGRARAP